VASSFLTPILESPATRWTLRDVTSRRAIATRIEIAFDSASRRKGLLGRTELADDTALVLAPCSSIHTFFMRFAIDVLFVDRRGRVVKASPHVPPWRIRIAWRSFAVVELSSGKLERIGTRVGDLVELAAE
jgi:uncharacterized membrane protein (UPF0127 family)